jgi:hypothetical protein
MKDSCSAFIIAYKFRDKKRQDQVGHHLCFFSSYLNDFFIGHNAEKLKKIEKIHYLNMLKYFYNDVGRADVWHISAKK